MTVKDEDLVTLKGKRLYLPNNRRKILRTWFSDEDITKENKIFELQYNALPNSKEYVPIKILEGGIASIVVLTAGNKVIKNAELSLENKGFAMSMFSNNKNTSNVLRYEMISESLLICDYLSSFTTMEDISDGKILNFIEELVDSIRTMNDTFSPEEILIDPSYTFKPGLTGYNVHFPEFLDYAIKKDKILEKDRGRLLFLHRELNDLPKRVIHGDVSRKNVMHKGNTFMIIDPKINFGRPYEDLARFILKGGRDEHRDDVTNVIAEIKKYLSETEFEEFEKWLFIYTISLYTEYINIERTEKSKLIVGKIDRMFEYIAAFLERQNKNRRS